jgi:transcription initiation factor TFIIB
VYNACLDVGEKRTQDELSEIANVTQVTIRNRYQEQRQLLREVESLPSDPIELINHIADESDVEEAPRELAAILIRNARSAGYSVDEEATLWALAALRRASQLIESDIQLKTLSQYTDKESNEISSRTRDLRSVLDNAELSQFREEHL